MKELIYNEFRKIFLKKRIWGIAIILFIISGVFIGLEYTRMNRIKINGNLEHRLESEKLYKQNTEDTITELKEKIKNADEDKKLDLQLQLKDAQKELTYNDDKIFDIERQIKTPLTPEEKLDRQIENVEQNLKRIPKNDSAYYRYLNEYSELKYLKDHNMTLPDKSFTATSFMERYFSELGVLVIPLIIMIIVGDIVSGECTPGTFKFLLIQPVSKRKILFSKYIAAIVTSFVIVFSIELISFLFVGITFGFGDMNNPILVGTRYFLDNTLLKNGAEAIKVLENSTYAISTIKYILSMFVYNVFVILACASFGFLISTLINNNMISMITSMASVVALSVSSQFVANLKILSLIIFTNHGDISSILDGSIIARTGNLNFTPANGAIVLISITILCYLISQAVFVRKDFYI